METPFRVVPRSCERYSVAAEKDIYFANRERRNRLMSSRIPAMAMLVAAWMLLISPPAQAAKEKRVARSYSVAQILSYVAQSETAKAENSDNEGKPGTTAEDKLIDLIVSTVQPDSWQPNGGHGKISYEPASKSLVIHQTPAVHDEIANLLAALARLMDVQVAIEIRHWCRQCRLRG